MFGKDAYSLARCGALPDLPATTPGLVRQSRLGSRRVVIGYPTPHASRLPVTVLLHGAAGDARTPFDVYGIGRHLAGLGFAVAAVDDWPSWDLVRDLLPHLAEQGLRTGGIGLMGWSFGGAGALRLAASLGPSQVSAVSAASPAITAGEAPLRELAKVPVWLGCGSTDPLAPETSDMLADLRKRGGVVAGGISSGCHDAAFRRRVMAEQLAFMNEYK